MDIAERTLESTLNAHAAALAHDLDAPRELTRMRYDAVTSFPDPTSVTELLSTLDATEVVMRTMKAKQTSAVLDLRALGASWQQIADALNVSKQAVHKRFQSLA